MKQLNAFIAVCFVMVFVVVAASCSKTGPAGPAGATGATGPAGPTGATGVKGDTGVANVIYSAWLDVPSTYSVGTSADTTWRCVITATKLDSVMLSKGEIKVYYNFGSLASPLVVPLPYFDGDIINVFFQIQKITVLSTFNIGTVTQAGVKYQQFRYILIPGGKAGRSAIDWNNYAEVQKYLGLKD